MMNLTVKMFDIQDGQYKFGNSYIPKDMLQKAVKEYLEKTPPETRVGQLFNNRDSELALGSITHKIKDINITDSEITADIQILDTPQGKLVQNIIKAQSSPNAASIQPTLYGKQKQTEDGKTVITEISEIRSFDFVI